MTDPQETTARRCFALWCCLLCAVLSGCALPEPRPVSGQAISKESPEKIIQREKTLKPPGPPPFTEKLAPAATGLIQDDKLYSMVFTDAPLSAVISAITLDTDLNMSVESGVDLSRSINVKLNKVTLREALDMVVVKGAGYAWKIDGDNISIRRFDERIYQMDYLDMAGETSVQVGGDMLSAGVTSAGVTGKFQVKIDRPAENADVWTAIKADLEGLKSEAGILRINRNAGVIYMADTPRKLETMVQFLDSLTESLHRQVFLEAKIMEVRLSDTYKYGIDWTKFTTSFKASGDPDLLNIEFNSGGSIAKASQSSLNLVVDFLRTQGDVTVLSNPHMSVMNGRSAVMTVGFQFPYGDVDGVDRDPETGVITFGTTIKRTVLGLQMGITPQISQDGNVTLYIVPTITRIQDEQAVELPTSATTTQTISNPIIDLQELATTVRVQEGQSVVLAGLISQLRSLEHQGLPWLSTIPGIKYFFKSAEDTTETRELVIFITPYIKNESRLPH